MQAERAKTSPLAAVIPLRISGRHYWDNALRVSFLFSSLAHFAAPGTFEEITVIVPAREFAEARALAALWPSLPIRVAAEHQLLPDVFAQRKYPWLRPWHFQQLIKFGACVDSRSPLVMVFDPDVVATRPFSLSDLVADGRPVLHTEAKAVHRGWWQASAGILDVAVDWAKPGLSVTPQILRADLCRDLLARIESLHGRPWPAVLRDRSFTVWTEYTLYGLYCESEGCLDSHHVFDGGRVRKIMCGRSIWQKHEFDAAYVRGLFSGDDAGIFLVIQSASGIPAATLKEMFASGFPLAEWRPTVDAGTPISVFVTRLAEWFSGTIRKGAHALQRLLARQSRTPRGA